MVGSCLAFTIISAVIGTETTSTSSGRSQSKQKPMATVMILLAFAFLTIFGIVLYCYCQNGGSSYGRKSNINKIEEYFKKHGSDFEKRMNAQGYSIDWEFIERGIIYTKKVSGRRRDFVRRYPAGWVFFFATTGRNHSDRIKQGHMA